MTEPTLHLSIPVDDLATARHFYEVVLGCRVGRIREGWLDVWFFGMQLTLHERPDEVSEQAAAGVRHFGVVLHDADTYQGLVDRVSAHPVQWLAEPTTHADPTLSGKTGGKIADPAGNVIEIKFYEDSSEFLARS